MECFWTTDDCIILSPQLIYITRCYCSSVLNQNIYFQVKTEPRTESSRTRTVSNSQGAESSRTRTVSNSQGAAPVVNVQKLESMAPEFQTLTDTMRRGAQPSSILVDKDGHPSPTKSSSSGEEHLFLSIYQSYFHLSKYFLIIYISFHLISIYQTYQSIFLS